MDDYVGSSLHPVRLVLDSSIKTIVTPDALPQLSSCLDNLQNCLVEFWIGEILRAVELDGKIMRANENSVDPWNLEKIFEPLHGHN